MCDMTEQVIIIGAGPCGISAALELKKQGINPLLIEKGNIVHTIYRFPTHQTFFSSSFNLEIGDIPFVSEKDKPVRLEALAYYREVVKRNHLRIHAFEEVLTLQNEGDHFNLTTTKQQYTAKNVIIATGYYDQPNYLHIPGEEQDHVFHYFKEAHPYYDLDVVVIGGNNSAVDAALELTKAGARVTVLYRGKDYSKSIKPWILPGFDSLVKKGAIQMEFQAEVIAILQDKVQYEQQEIKKEIKSDVVFAMTGYKPNIPFLKKIGIHIDEKTGRPAINAQTFETNISNIYIAGVVISGYNGNETFIENGKLHGIAIAQAIKNKQIKSCRPC